ncbi:MFS transporter [Nakamurella leprariae]|uniref:MFS transporter n=1 Tax=Nakamurella leprariae TaxID=2803911 RepID=A0A938Y5N0_9ACTN|nr:MFS transporter [Nakamurella leprariae]MBM9466486.1 MFS transporter [Nakamurella leprariae]
MRHAGGPAPQDDHTDGAASRRPRRLLVQDYLDETPRWPDGTPSRPPMTRMQRRIWLLASAGKFFEGAVVFLTGIALPLIHGEWDLSTFEMGLVSAASLFGILIGASALGGLSDRFGRRSLFLIEMVLFTAFLVGVLVSPELPVLIACLFGLGLALGCDYPTAHLMISETISSQSRGRLVLSAFAFQSLGAMAGTLIGLVVLGNATTLGAWRWMFGIIIVPAVIVTVARLFVTQSPHWLVIAGRVEDAQREMQRLLKRQPPYPSVVTLHAELNVPEHGKGRMRQILRPPWRRSTVLASVPWFLQDLGTYGIGIFTPVIIASTLGSVDTVDGSSPANPAPQHVAQIVQSDALGTKGAAMIDILLVVGILLAILLVDRVGRIKLQVVGFIGCAAGLAIAAASAAFTGGMQTLLIFAGFMIFNLMTNLGPNAMTYLLAGEVFPTHLRGTGAGFAASAAKVGAVLTAFLFPVLLADLGQTVLLLILVGTSLLGAVVTWRFRVETGGQLVSGPGALVVEPGAVAHGSRDDDPTSAVRAGSGPALVRPAQAGERGVDPDTVVRQGDPTHTG